MHNCFGVFWCVCFYAYPKRFMGEGKVVLVFEIIYLFFDLQVIFDGQVISIINSILFHFLWLIVCHWWAGNFVNNFCHSSKTIVMCMGVTRLDDAWDNKKILAPPYSNLGSLGSKYAVLKKCLWHCCEFWPPQWFDVRRIFPLTSRYVSDVMQ